MSNPRNQTSTPIKRDEPAKLPDGRQRLSPRWYQKEDLAPGTTVLAREILQRERAIKRACGRLKRDTDTQAQRSARSYANWSWLFDHDAIEYPSSARH